MSPITICMRSASALFRPEYSVWPHSNEPRNRRRRGRPRSCSLESFQGASMTSNRKIWLGVGAFVVVGTGALAANGLPADVATLGGVRRPSGLATDTAIPRTRAGGFVLAQHGDHAKEAPKEAPKEPGKDGEG